jgi:hypothetical protein
MSKKPKSPRQCTRKRSGCTIGGRATDTANTEEARSVSQGHLNFPRNYRYDDLSQWAPLGARGGSFDRLRMLPLAGLG